jgi:transposase-like protein
LNSLVVRTEMLEIQTNRPVAVTGPLGEKMTRADLPPRNTQRWIARRKAEVVAAVSGGLLTISEACERYDLTLEEFASWQRAVEREGLPGLRVSRAQFHRDHANRKVRH